MRLAPLFALTVVVAAACGGSRDRPDGTRDNNGNANNTNTNNGSAVTPDHPAICNQACSAPREGPCATADSDVCVSACAAKTNGLSAQCATCITSLSGYAGQACTCYGEGCVLCPFAPGDTTCSGAGPGDTCSASEEVCDGFEAADIIGGPCEAPCLSDDANPPNLGPTLEDRCKTLCEDRPSACAAASTSDCLTSCLTAVSASEGTCALCRLEASGWAGQACTCYGAGCGLCPFGPEDSPCAGPTPDDTCSSTDEVCDGLELAPPTGACARLCL